LVLFGFCYLSFFEELPLLVMQSVHNCTWIKHGSGPGIAYYHFNDFSYKVEVLLNTMPVGCTGIEHGSGSGINFHFSQK
jgi:hypothetical protein